MQKSQIGTILLVFIGVIIGIAMLSGIATTVSEQTNVLSAANETVNIVTARYGGSQINTSRSTFTLSKDIVTLPLTVLTGNNTLTTLYVDYNISLANNTIMYYNTSRMSGDPSNTTQVSYDWITANYNADGPSRTIVTLIVLFGALGIIVFALKIWYNDDLLSIFRRD